MKTDKNFIALDGSNNNSERVYSSPTIDIISLYSNFRICETSGENMTPENGIW